jgi:hypothetical protein
MGVLALCCMVGRLPVLSGHVSATDHHYLPCTCIAAVLLCPAALANWVAAPRKPGQEVDTLQAQGRILPGGGRGGSKPVQMLASDNVGRGLLGAQRRVFCWCSAHLRSTRLADCWQLHL